MGAGWTDDGKKVRACWYNCATKYVAYISISNSRPRYSDVCVACGLVSTAGIVFVVMFMPKGRQLSAMGREGLYAEDRTGLATNSIFSVSFYQPRSGRSTVDVGQKKKRKKKKQ